MRRVAIIDDLLPNALLLKGYISRLDNIDSTTFTDPVEALVRCKETVPDLVLLDYHMPQMNGVDFLKRFRSVEHLKDIPIVMITAEERKNALYEALDAGAIDFLRKPVDDIELITRVRNLLDLRGRQIDLANANEKLYTLATTDHLTNLKNRRYFLEKLQVEVERSCRYDRPFSIAILDADRFKSINDTHGHDAGDQVLQEISRVLSQGLRDVDLIGRVGGEEFAIQFPETNKARALEVCERLLSSIRSRTVMAKSREINFTVSVGIAEIIPRQDKVDAILKRADQALYHAKARGRDRCEVA